MVEVYKRGVVCYTSFPFGVFPTSLVKLRLYFEKLRSFFILDASGIVPNATSCSEWNSHATSRYLPARYENAAQLLQVKHCSTFHTRYRELRKIYSTKSNYTDLDGNILWNIIAKIIINKELDKEYLDFLLRHSEIDDVVQTVIKFFYSIY